MTPKPKKPGGDTGGEGTQGKPSQKHGSVDASKGVESAQEATATAAQKGRPAGDGQPPKEQGPTPTTSARPDFEDPKFDDRKLTEYALNPDHPVGGNKARVIKSATGLGPDDAAAVKQQILDQVKQGEPIPGKIDEHGTRWGKDVTLTDPMGPLPCVPHGSSTPRPARRGW